MAVVNKLMCLRPFASAVRGSPFGQSLCGAFSANLLPKRTRAIYCYTTKKKRAKKDWQSSKNLEWAKPVLEMAKSTEELETPGKEPHMLHLVCLIKPTKGRPWWEKDLIEKLGLEGKRNRPVILKNIPSVNKMLFEVKHLLKVLPLTFPHGLPEHESDFEHTIIKSNGEMVVAKRLKEYEPEGTKGEPNRNVYDLQLDTIKRYLDKKLLDFNVHTEYHKTKYVYRFNQDGKEYRYNFNKDVPKFEF